MNRYHPLTSNFSTTPALLVDTQAPLANLQECATARIHAAGALLESLTSLASFHSDAADLLPGIKAAHLLLSDGTDILGVIEYRTGLLRAG